MPELIIFSVICVVMTAVFLIIRVNKKPIFGMLAKILPSISFVILGAVGVMKGIGTLPSASALIVAGLSLGLVGDILLDMKRVQPEFEDIYLFSGMGAFALGHIVYITSISIIAAGIVDNIWLPAVVSTAIAIAAAPVIMIVAVKFMNSKFGKFFSISMAYAALLVFVTAYTAWLTALDFRFFPIAIGMVCFLLSDLVLSTQYFVEGKKEDKGLVIINHALYYAAQILVGAFIFALI